MRRTQTQQTTWRTLLALALVAVLPSLAAAQTGSISGSVTDEQLAPIAGVQVSVQGTNLGSLTDEAGRFTVSGVPAGSHQVRVQFTGYASVTRSVSIAAGETATLEIRLASAAYTIDGVVVSASRREQRLTEAPATITRIDTDLLDSSVGNTWIGALKEARGLDFIQLGMTSAAVNARGFNSSFNNRMLMMEDGRIAVLPENGLPVGQFTAVPKVDLAGIEVLVGPGAALYGADASSGVITLLTKDPRQFPGTTVEVTGGNNNYKDIQFRHAGVLSGWGYKVAGEWQEAEEFSNVLPYNVTGPNGTPVQVWEDDMGPNSISWDAGAVRGTGAIVRYFEDGQIELSAGASESDGVGQTNVGRNQLRDWGYNFQQLRFSNSNWFVNAYRTQSQSGESFALNRYAAAYGLNPSAPAEDLRLASDWPSDGQMYAAEVQNNFSVGQLLGTHLTWGAQFRRDVVSSDRQWLSDRLTGEDLQMDQYGVYAQTETPVAPWLDVVIAARLDDHQNYETQFSPKAGVVLKPAAGQAFRVTYNRAFKSPTTLQTEFWIPDWTAALGIYGNKSGFTVRNAAGEVVRTYEPLRPEENVTLELGYKGVFNGNLFVDVAGYYSQYDGFLSPLAFIADPFGIGLAGNPAGEAWIGFHSDGEMIQTTAGTPALALTYLNLGDATIYGTDAGFNYYLSPRVVLKGNVSWLKLHDADSDGAGGAEATALNSPNTRWTAGADFTDVGSFLDGQGNFNAGFDVRHVGSYRFHSGINRGVIPTFSTLDLSFGYKLERYNSMLNLSLANVFTCSQDPDSPFTYADSDPGRMSPTNKERKCGFGVEHQEMINMPQIGTMVFLGLRYFHD